MVGRIPTESEYNYSKDESLLVGESINRDILIDQNLFGQNMSLSPVPSNVPMNAGVRQPDGKR
ncbi:MAG: hypothetical protein WA941_23600 [Nitrososphaeraceae archaeon]